MASKYTEWKDLQNSLQNKYTVGYDWLRDTLRLDHRFLDKDLYIFDLYKPDGWNIHCCWYTLVGRMEVFQNSLVSKNMTEIVRILCIVH